MQYTCVKLMEPRQLPIRELSLNVVRGGAGLSLDGAMCAMFRL